MKQLLLKWRVELAIALILLITGVGVLYKYQRLHNASPATPLPKSDTESVRMSLLVRDCPSDIARIIAVGDPYIFKGEQMAAIDRIERNPARRLSFDGSAYACIEDSENYDLILDISIRKWIYEFAQFKLGQLVEYETPNYALSSFIIKLPPEPMPSFPSRSAYLMTAVARNVPYPIESGLLSDAFGVDENGQVELLLLEAERIDNDYGMPLTIYLEGTSPDQSIAPVSIRTRGEPCSDYRLKLRIWPRVKDGMPYYNDVGIRIGRTFHWSFKQFQIKAIVTEIVEESRSADSGNP